MYCLAAMASKITKVLRHAKVLNKYITDPKLKKAKAILPKGIGRHFSLLRFLLIGLIIIGTLFVGFSGLLLPTRGCRFHYF
jgi:hypothetical protein